MDDIIITVDVDPIDIVITVSTGEGDFMLTSGTNSDIDYLDFDLTPATAVNAPGRLWWNEAAKTLSLGLLDGGSYEFGNSTAASTSFAPYKSISASNVQRAIEELIDENVDYLLKYVVPKDVASISLTTDQYGNAFNFVEGDEIEVIIQVKSWPSSTTNRLDLRFNNNTNSVYRQGATGYLSYLYTLGTNYASQYSIITFTCVNGDVNGLMVSQSTASATYSFHTEGLNSTINSIQLSKSSTSLIPAGAVIIIKKK